METKSKTLIRHILWEDLLIGKNGIEGSGVLDPIGPKN